jgi:hypothetical protein
MSFVKDPRKYILDDLELKPRTLSTVPAGVDGQIAIVTDQGPVNLMVREGGALVPAVDVSDRLDRTTSAITMQISLTGTSPPTGTIVHSQAEYDALGYSLRYIQDAIEILPIGLAFPVLIELGDGVHLAKVGGGGRPTFSACFIAKGFIQVNKFRQQPVGAINSSVVILVKGKNRNVLLTDAAGTCGGRGSITGITPGGMTIDQYMGKLLIIKTGANAGTIMPIRTNGIDFLNGPALAMSSGACTFDIYEPLAAVIPSTDGITQNASFLSAPINLEVQLIFQDFDLGTVVVGANYIQVGPLLASIRFNYCRIRFTGTTGTSFMAIGGNSILLLNCLIQMVACAGNWSSGLPGSLLVAGCIVKGNPVEPFFSADAGGTLSFYYTSIEPDTGWTGTVFSLRAGNLVMSGENWLFGHGPCTAIKVTDIYNKGTSVVYGYYLWIEGVDTMFDISGSMGLTLEHYSQVHCGIDNNVGWRISNGARVLSDNFVPENPMLVSDIIIDGVAEPFSKLSLSGDEIVGRYGSRVIRHG